MLSSSYRQGAADALIKLAGPDWANIPLSDFGSHVDPMLQELHTRANELGASSHLLKRKQLLRRQLELQELARDLEMGHQHQVARNMQDFQQQYANKGMPPQAPAERSLLNKLTFGRFGRAANKPAAAYRPEDISAAVRRAREVLPGGMDEVMAAYGKGGKKGFRAANKLQKSRLAEAAGKAAKGGGGGGMGGLGRLALGAGVLAGGGMLLNNLLTPDDPNPSDPAYANFR